ncbi:alpha/beta-hydrolase [Agrocybe pediades]|nr:alpha/beta-hydrolase [Agrocybe pediades]
MSETPFKISVSDERLYELKQKLALTVFPDELEDSGWDYGLPLSVKRRLVERWRDGYDWRKHEVALNDELPQFTRDIDVEGHGTLDVHYVHKESDVVDAIPLLFVHGWPGSFIEVRKILPLLIQGSPDHPAFHVVAISLPGYGFSEGPRKKGFEVTQYAEVCHKLMLALGYNEYVTQGGDWGAVITTKMAGLYGGTHIKAFHTNMPRTSPPTLTSKPLVYLADLIFGYTEREKANLKRAQWFQEKMSGWFVQQSTQPQTIGYSLADSPVGLLSWIYDKLVWGSDEYPWEDDEALTWISIYWFSRAGPTASFRIYCEVQRLNINLTASVKNIPVGMSHFPKEVFDCPRRWFKAPNLVFESEHDTGGHYAAYEKPEALVDDLRRMFGKGSKVFGIVPGKTGFS